LITFGTISWCRWTPEAKMIILFNWMPMGSLTCFCHPLVAEWISTVYITRIGFWHDKDLIENNIKYIKPRGVYLVKCSPSIFNYVNRLKPITAVRSKNSIKYC
jgi:hypothetical protein